MTEASATVATDWLGSRKALDPRTAMAVILVANAVGFSPFSPNALVFSLIVLVCVLLVTTRRWLFFANYTAVMTLAGILAFLLYQGVSHPVPATLGLLGHYLLRFGVVFGAGSYLFLTTRPTELLASLRALHVPNLLLVPLAVMLRFLPTIAAEGRHIVESMRLRHIFPSQLAMVAHPLRTLEYLVVPLISSALRIGEDLSASALLRGLGGAAHPTSVTRLGLRWPDVVVLLLLGSVIAAWIVQRWVL